MRSWSANVIVAPVLALLVINLQPATVLAQGTAFTYQGRLNDGGTPAQGIYDFRFKLFVDPLGNTQVGSVILTNGIPLTNGLFALAIDFGAGVFNGSNYWLEVDVRTNGGGSYTDLNPLQPVTPAPYAIFANTASNVSGTISSANLSGTYSGPVMFNNSGNSFSGTFTGNGANLVDVNAAALSGLGASNFWQSAGNAGTTPGVNFVGTKDNQPLELRANAQRILRLVPDPGTNNAPDIVGGSPTNAVTPGLVGATISGGAMNTIGPAALFSASNPYGDLGSYPTLGASFSTLGGGFLNQIQSNATFSTVAGGALNTIQAGAIESTIGGGFANTILSNGLWSIIAGGTHHTIGSDNGFIGGGWLNSIQTNSSYSAIGGGQFNRIPGNAGYAFIGGGAGNIIGPDGFGTGGGNYSAIGGGYENAIYEYASFIGGGQQNQIQSVADHSVIGGGESNSIAGSVLPPLVAGVIGGGQNNIIQTNSISSVIGGGFGNTIQSNAFYAVVPGGSGNLAGGSNSLAAGSEAQATNNGAFVWSDTSTTNLFNSTGSNQFLIRAAGGVGIGTNSPAAALDVVAGGGGTNIALRVGNGGLAVSGAGIGAPTAAFIHLSSAANSSGDSTFINNPLCNGDPNALLLVTHSFNPPNGTTRTYFNKNFGVWYDGNQWAIYNEDVSDMPTNIAFNVLIIKQ